METTYTAIARSIGGRNGHVSSSDGILNFNVRPPHEMGGPEGVYTNPEQLFAAGYAACFGSALNHVALLQRIRVEPDVTAKVTLFKPEEGNGFSLSVELEVRLPGMDQHKAEALVREAHQVCPYSNATRNNIEVKLTTITTSEN